MKRKLLCLFLLLTLVFAVGCNKKEDKATPTPTTAATQTPTSTPTPTPLPENLAKTNLEKLPAVLDTLMSYQPKHTVDSSKGIGYDISLEMSLGQQIAELLELSRLDSVSVSGSLDIKETIAANLSMYLNTSEVINAHVFADANNVLYNLPKYSSNYAATTWTELMNSLNEEDAEGETSEDSSLTGSSYDVIRTISTVDQQTMPSDEELVKSLRTHLENIVNCFQEVDGITEKASIGTGDYTMTGDKHTVSANLDELYAVLESLETELQNYGDISFGLEDSRPENAASFILDYYVDENGNYAWAGYPDTAPNEPLVFISTDLGFCLYRVNEDGTTTLGMTSIKSTETSGVIYLLFNDDATTEATDDTEAAAEPLATIDYEYDDNSFYIYAILDTIELILNCSTENETITYDMTMIVEGMSFVINETVAKNHVDASFTLASYGIEYVTMAMTADLRDYVEIPIPQNTVTVDTWTTELDQDALLNDLIQLMTDYPFLVDLILGSDDETGDEYDDNTGTNDGSSAPPEDYTDDFMGMTGYAVDEDGYVDFDPLEEEVLAAGKPSTGFDTLKITDDQKQAMFDIAEKAIANCEKYSDTYYWVWGSTEYNDVRSYYTTSYDFDDPDNWDNSISFEFDAVSGEFVSVEIYNVSKDEALRIANEIFVILGGDYTLTDEMVEDYTYTDGFSFSGYDAAQYGSNYYNVGISIYYPEW